MREVQLMETSGIKTVHKFEQAGLGKAPFRFVGFEVRKFQACPGAPIQAGTCCDYCSSGIMNVFHVKSADGKRFKVGSDCILSVGDVGLRREVDRVVRAHENELRKAREARKVAALRAAWTPEKRAELASRPHPHSGLAASGKTLADYVDFCLDNGVTKAARYLAELLGVSLKGV